jgi:plastocyanin
VRSPALIEGHSEGVGPLVQKMRISLRMMALCFVALSALELQAQEKKSGQSATTPPTNAATVTISSGRPLPRTVHIALGYQVNWVNDDDRPHLVKAVNDAFPQFSLNAKGLHTVRFSKPGSYPYKVDGEADGVIVVVDRGSGGGAGGGGGELPGGEMWKGNLHAKSSQFFGPGGQCVDEEWDIKLDLVVLKDGTVTGKGDGQLASMPKCSGGARDHVWRYDLEGHTISCPGIRGRFDGKEFQLQFPAARPGEEHGTLGGIVSLSGYPPSQNTPTLRVQVIGPGMAKGQTKTDVDMGAPRHAAGIFDIALTCANCRK